MKQQNDKWIYYLSRPFTLLGASLWHNWYNCEYFKKIFGIILPSSLFLETTKNIFTYYRKESEQNALLEKTKWLLTEKSEAILDYLEKAKELNKEATGYINKGIMDRPIDEIIDFYNKLTVYATILPFFIGNNLDQNNSTQQKMLSICNELRNQSLYPVFYEKVILPKVRNLLKEFPEEAVEVVTFSELKNENKNFLKKRLGLRSQGKLFAYKVENEKENIDLVENIGGAKKKYGIEIAKEDKEIKGASAYKGKVTGTARLVLTNNLKTNFNRGDILVSISTSPVLMPIIQKAAAIVTDEGGVTCHAAIVARELKKPCIIGTKFATQILKDGDLVEVDAERGIVKIIERSPEYSRGADNRVVRIIKKA